MAFIWVSLCLAFFVKNAASQYNPSICSVFETSCGLIPPPLPRNFEFKGEVVDLVQNESAYMEIYFDSTNSRAKSILLKNTTEYHHLFDYQTQQVMEWVKLHPGVSMKRDPLSLYCTATDMSESPHTYVFGYKDWITQHPKMFNSYEMLRFGGPYLYAFNGTMTLYDRNLKVNKFNGCIYDQSSNATMFNSYYFADTNIVQPSGGTPSSLLTASPDDKPLSVPVKMHATGKHGVGTEEIPIDRTLSISWFKGKPEFSFDTFLIPPWVNCKDYRGRKEMPKMPNAFSTRVDVTSFMVDSLGDLVEQQSDTSYEEIYYDGVRNLARRDFTPNRRQDTEFFGKFGTYTPVSTIYDFNEGLMFAIHKSSGRCFIRPIVENEFFDTEEELLYRKLGSPEEIFRMQMDDTEYKGKNVARDVTCDVFNGKHYHKVLDATFIKETYYSTDGWHELVDGMEEYATPVKHLIITESVDGNLTESVISYDFLKFKAKSPPLALFDIKNCVEQITHKRFAIQLVDGPYLDTVFQFKFLFLDAAQMFIANKTEVHTPLRVQRLHLRHLSASKPKVFLVFSLLDKANLNDLPVVVSQLGIKLDDAVVLLQKLVEARKFSIQFKNPKTDELIIATGLPTLYTLNAEGGLNAAPKFVEPQEDEDSSEPRIIYDDHDGMAGEPNFVEPQEAEDITEKRIIYKDHNGMTAGHLALLAFAMLFIGLGIGIAVMYLYVRVYSERQRDDRINLQTKSSNADESDP